MNNNLFITALIGALSIIIGAFGAHKLKEILTPDAIESIETAVRYQMFHVLVLLFVNTYSGYSSETKNLISLLFFIGIILFSGSIYLIQIAKVPAKTIWFVTPIGGLLLIVGWVVMAIKFIK